MGNLEFSQHHIDRCLNSKMLKALLQKGDETSLIHSDNCRSFQSGSYVESQSTSKSYVLVPLEGEFYNVMSLQNENEMVGQRLANNDFNFSVLDINQKQKRVRALSDGLLLCVDLEVWASRFHITSQELLLYIEILKSSSMLLDLMVSHYELGGSLSYRIEALKRIKTTYLKSDTSILRSGQIPERAIYVIAGSLVAKERSHILTRNAEWSLPRGSWLFLTEAFEKTSIKFDVFCTEDIRAFEISNKNFLELESLNKQQSELLKNALLQLDQADPDEEDEEIESLLDLFPSAQTLPKKRFLFQYPFVSQNNVMDCGPACLAMVSKFFGKDIPLQYWKEWTETSRDGTSLFDLARTAEEKGFIAHSIHVQDINEIDKELFPFICLRKAHFMVVYAINEDTVVVGDPGVGIRELSMNEFKEDFSEAILLLKPTDTLFNLNTPNLKHSHYFQFLRGLRNEVVLVLISSVTLTFLSLFSPLLSQIIVDNVLAKKDSRLLGITLGVIGIVIILQSFIQWVKEYYIHFLSTRFDFNSTVVFLRKVLSLPYPFFAKHHVGDFTRRLAELERLRLYFTENVLSIGLELLTLFIYGAALFLYSWKIGMVAVLLAPVLMLLSMAFSPRLSRLYNETFESRAKQDSLFTDQIRGVKTLKALRFEVPSRWRFEEKFITTIRTRQKFLMTGASLRAFAGAYNQALRFGLMGLAAYLAIDGQMTPGQVIAVSLIASRFIDPFFNLSAAWTGLQEIKIVLSRLNDVFLATSEKVDDGHSKELKPFEGRIEFQDVWFRYGGESSEWVLKGVSFVIDPGKFVTIVGASGSGKSTIAQLLLRLIEPNKGRILIDGVNYQEYSTAWIRSKLGIVQQESILFEGTILMNIGYGDPYPKVDKIVEAAEIANATAFIEKKPRRFDYYLSHQGTGLSDGEKQRISLARTLYVDNPILVLDEATSVLDGISEKKLLSNLRKSRQNRTIINVSHRSSTLDISDYVILIDAGKVVEVGPHSRMINSSKLYQDLFGTQLQGASYNARL